MTLPTILGEQDILNETVGATETLAFNLSQHFQNDPISFFMKALFLFTALCSLLTLITLLTEKHQSDVKLGLAKSRKTKFGHQIKIIREYRENLTLFLRSKDMEHLVNTYFWVTMGLLIGSFIFLILMKQLILAIAFPVILMKFLNYIISYSIRQTIEDIEEQLPYALDRLIRVLTKEDDFRRVLYSTSMHIEDPLQSIFEDLAVKMSSGYKTDTLMALGNRFNNIWIWSFVFISVGYTTNTSKSETLESYRSLRVLLETENTAKKNQARERKYGVAINYVLIIVAFAAFIANLIFNPIAKDFFFASMGGLICLALGFGSIFSTIIINIKMTKRK